MSDTQDEDLSRFDYDPEDSYDATDPIEDRLDVLERVVDNLRDHRDDRFVARLVDLRRLVDNLDAEDLNFRENRRLRKLRDDVEEL
jgi:hypothetical protein